MFTAEIVDSEPLPVSPGRAASPVNSSVIAPLKAVNRPGTDNQTGVILETRPETKKPAMFKVFLLNDDYTPMEFVVHVLERFFAKSRDEATKIMLLVHQKGIGLCGVYTFEIAETKVAQVIAFARRHQHPLQCTVEKD
ncbi:MAG: ATP-dependent Clp protease adapter ClpS [Alphaproteobacteria bacterium]|nr:ATP-dependent Clp protease adapter ClpS [Alphaproteobacteria bacterium]